MTQLRERPAVTTSPTVSRRTRRWEWTSGIVGLVAAAIGTWMLIAPDDGMISFFGWDWNVAEIHVIWPVTMIVLGAVLIVIAAAMLIPLRRRD